MSEIIIQPFNDTRGSIFNITEEHLPISLAMSLLCLLICLLGLVGNGIVLWCLCFRIQRNPFTVYILNLAAADFFFLFCSAVALIYGLIITAVAPIPHSNEHIVFALRILYTFGYATSLYLLTAMSVERCLSVLYPIWYKCHRPRHLSTIACVLLLVFSILNTYVTCSSCTNEMYMEMTPKCIAIVLFLFCLSFGFIIPIMVLSSVLLIIKVQRSSMRRQPMRLYRVIISNVLFFLVVTFPTGLSGHLLYFHIIDNSEFNLLMIGHAHVLCSILNSSANPFIYFLMGRTKNKRSMGFIKEALLRVFRVDHEISCDDLNIG